MFDSKAKISTLNFLRHIQVLAHNSNDRIIGRFQEAQNKLVAKFIAEAEELINRNEWGIAFENLLDNLFEIEFKLDRKAIDLAKHAIEACQMDYNKWRFIEELVK